MARSPSPPARAAGLVLALLAVQSAGPARAGGPSSCGCTPSPTPPSSGSVKTYSYGAGSATATSAVSVTTSLKGSAVTGAQALANSVGGGYGTFSEQGGVTTTIEAVQVEGAGRRICSAFKSLVRTALVRASCLDDKDVPHPASQVSPERRIPDAFEGEIYRCIAGTRLQYTLAPSESAVVGQSVGCAKGQALYRRRDGLLECRAQTPARDCNERSLLRRYGAGVKTLTVQSGQECVAWREEAALPSEGGGALHVELAPGDP